MCYTYEPNLNYTFYMNKKIIDYSELPNLPTCEKNIHSMNIYCIGNNISQMGQT